MRGSTPGSSASTRSRGTGPRSLGMGTAGRPLQGMGSARSCYWGRGWPDRRRVTGRADRGSSPAGCTRCHARWECRGRSGTPALPVMASLGCSSGSAMYRQSCNRRTPWSAGACC